MCEEAKELWRFLYDRLDSLDSKYYKEIQRILAAKSHDQKDRVKSLLNTRL